MAHRGTESPMDFEWQGRGTGPIDVSSPFHRFTTATTTTTTMKRSHSQLAGDGALPSLSEPNGRPWFFSNMPPTPTQTQSQQSPFRSPSFTTPRKPFDIDFSSGPESSPADAATPAAANDDTPEPRPFEFKSNAGTDKDNTDNNNNNNNKRNSLFGMYGRFAPSPSTLRKPFNDALEKRIQQRRRRRAQDFSASREIVLSRQSSRDSDDAGRDDDETDDDDDGDGDDDDTLSSLPPAASSRRRQPHLQSLARPRSRSPRKRQTSGGGGGGGGGARKRGKASEQAVLTQVFTFLTTYPSAPAIIAKYLQIAANVVIFAGVFYLLWAAVATVRGDIERLADESVAEMVAEMSACSKNYVENRCAPADARLPALEAVCTAWELCMQRDPHAVRRARLSAHTLADILNGFVEPIAWKTMVVMFAALLLVLLVTNTSFALYRRQYDHAGHQPAQPAVYWQPQHQPRALHPALAPASSWHYNGAADSPDQALLDWRGNGDADSPSKRYRTTASPEKKKVRV